MNIGSYYTAAIADCDDRLQRLRRQTNSVSALRVLIFAALVAALWQVIRDYSVGWAAGSAGLAAAFLAAVSWYFHLKDRRLLREKLVFVNTNEWTFLAGGPNQFPDGKPYLNGVIYGDDLDIFGPLSLFHALNRATTLHGTEALAGWLRQPLLSQEAIRQRQHAVRVLSGQADLRRLLTAKGLLATPGASTDLRTLTEWLNTPPRLFPLLWLRILLALMTLANTGLLLYGLSGGSYSPLIFSVGVSWIITGYFSKYVHRQHQLIGQKQTILQQYADILSVFSGVDTGGSTQLEGLRGLAREAHGAIRRLSRLTSFFDSRLNLLVFIFLNSLAFYDLQCIVALERWKARYRAKLPGWIGAVGEIEALNSVATFAFNYPGYVYPAPVADQNLFIDAKQLAHPLIPSTRRVANDVEIGTHAQLILVTGSNMSGKTTFLRTVGVNLLLAQCGAPVCAEAFSFTPMQLLTSLRISDSLQEQTSYFMAELKKLKAIVESLETGIPTLVLIDEILRGTNSEDKTYGSEHFAGKLLGYRCLALFATHDLALGALETRFPERVANYCFESVIEDGDLRFDYRLQRGIARNKNASFLMKKMGII
ncbi:MAG TPA: hypothetical protein VMH27_17015 [Puia sp.]|nr:hypothetical protein [Puia sp.]